MYVHFLPSFLLPFENWVSPEEEGDKLTMIDVLSIFV